MFDHLKCGSLQSVSVEVPVEASPPPGKLCHRYPLLASNVSPLASLMVKHASGCTIRGKVNLACYVGAPSIDGALVDCPCLPNRLTGTTCGICMDMNTCQIITCLVRGMKDSLESSEHMR